MRLVLDASAGVAVALRQQAGAALFEVLESATVVMAPDLYTAEVTSAIWKYVTAGRMAVEEATDRFEAALHLIDQRHDSAGLASEVLREASLRRHSTYDLFYAVLARREGATIVTLDTRLQRIAEAMKIPRLPR